jgi:N-methylhydantoinase B
VRRYQIRRGSGGKGRHNGGDGLIREIEFLTPCEVTILSDRRERGPYGLCGGEAGEPGRNMLDGRVVPAKANFQTDAGAVLRIETPGGGGWGS